MGATFISLIILMSSDLESLSSYMLTSKHIFTHFFNKLHSFLVNLIGKEMQDGNRM